MKKIIWIIIIIVIVVAGYSLYRNTEQNRVDTTQDNIDVASDTEVTEREKEVLNIPEEKLGKDNEKNIETSVSQVQGCLGAKIIIENTRCEMDQEAAKDGLKMHKGFALLKNLGVDINGVTVRMEKPGASIGTLVPSSDVYIANQASAWVDFPVFDTRDEILKITPIVNGEFCDIPQTAETILVCTN